MIRLSDRERIETLPVLSSHLPFATWYRSTGMSTCALAGAASRTGATTPSGRDAAKVGSPPDCAVPHRPRKVSLGASRAVPAAKAERPLWVRKRSTAADDWCSASDSWETGRG